jgi:hypothetical protein
MNWKMLAAILLGLAVGVAIPSLRWTQDVQAQRPEKAQQWEYKVVEFRFDLPAPVVEKEKAHAQRLNTLAGEGWEYVGLLSVSPRPSGTVAFKRPKR